MPLLPRVIPSPACSPTWAVWEQPSACLISLVCLLVPLVYVLGLFLWYRNRSRRKARQKAAGVRSHTCRKEVAGPVADLCMCGVSVVGLGGGECGGGLCAADS